MPKQSAKSGLTAKLGTVGAKAFEAHKADEVVLSAGGDLPAGIDDGIAKVKNIKFGQYKEGDFKGEYYYSARAIVVEPKKYAGLATQIGPEPMCDTPTRSRKTVEDHLAFVMNEYRKMGINTEEIGYDDLETTAAALTEDGPYIRFRTWKGSKQEIVEKNGKFYVGDKEYKTEAAAKAANKYVGVEPRTQHDWRGLAEGYVDESDASSGTEDETETEEAEAEAVEEEVVEEETVEEEVAEEETEVAEEEEEGPDLDALAKKADKKDKAAMKQLKAIALEAGLEEDAVDNADDWKSVVTMINDAATPAEEEEEAVVEEEEEWKPKKEETYKYALLNPKTKKKSNIDVEVMTVSEKNESVTLKNLETGKTLVGADKKPIAIKWDKLIREE